MATISARKHGAKTRIVDIAVFTVMASARMHPRDGQLSEILLDRRVTPRRALPTDLYAVPEVATVIGTAYAKSAHVNRQMRGMWPARLLYLNPKYQLEVIVYTLKWLPMMRRRAWMIREE
jgi:hypothetical protein